jgi:4-hydroxy-tetrahydrodipicolinate synthase
LDFGRVITAMVTPFDGNLNVNFDYVERFVDYLIDEQGSESLVVCGTTGESPTLTEEEKLELFKIVTARAKGRCKVIAGTGTYDTAHSIEMTKQAERIGVDGILLVSPYYNRPDQEGLYAHFRAVAEQTSLPVMLYNIPKRTGVTISADTIVRLARDCSNIVATKEAHVDLDLITSIIGQAPEGFKVYSGDDIMTLPMMSIGAHGVVSVASHVIGREIHQLLQTFLSGNVAEAARMHVSLQEKFNALFLRPNPVMVKTVLRNKGIDVGGVRLPLVNGSAEEERYITELFA